MIYTDVIGKIKTVANSIEEVSEVFMHPLGADVIDFSSSLPVRIGTRITQYPALIFAPDTFDNNFASTASNERTMRFKCWLVISAENIENIELFEKVLPNAIDGVLEKFDADFNFGTISGHRAWARMATGIFGITPESKGREAYCEMSLVVRVEVDN